MITVVICTRNRAASLRRVLKSLTRMVIPASLAWEIVIVDNGSTDDTAAIVESFTTVLPIRRVTETKPGLSNARNRGVAAAKGDYILWTDDDVEIHPGWLAAYARAFVKYPDGAVFGGRIIPVLEAPTPKWFGENTAILQWVLAIRDFGDVDLPLSVAADCLPFGANFAVRAAEQQNFLYDPMLGVSPGKRRIGEEMHVIRAILNAGNPGYWVADAKVEHIITAARQTTSYVRDYFRGHGETNAYLTLAADQHARARLLFHHGPRALGNIILFHGLRSILPPRRWLPRLMNSGYHLGAWDYARKTRLNHP